mgnify:CR=1 FL=1
MIGDSSTNTDILATTLSIDGISAEVTYTTKNSTLGGSFEPTDVLAMNIPHEILSHSTLAADFCMTMADIETW